MIVPNERISPADAGKPVTDEYIKALNLNRKIISSAQLAQQSLYEMCTAFKEMRDSRLYKELGYTDFGDYCEQETGIKRRQVYNYIAIAEKLPADFVQPVAQIGMRKLLLLTTITEEERAQITAETDLESATVKELENQIKQLRADKDKAIADKSAAEADSALKSDTIAALERTKQTLNERITNLDGQLRDLENRPIDVQIVEKIPDNYVTLDAMESAVQRERTAREEAEDDNIKLKREFNKTETELKQEIERLGKELEERSAAPAQVVQTDSAAAVFNAYLKSAYDAINRLVEYINEQNNAAYAEKAVRLIDSVKTSLGGGV